MATEQIGLLASDLTVMQQCYLSTMLTAPGFSLYKSDYGIDIVESQQ